MSQRFGRRRRRAAREALAAATAQAEQWQQEAKRAQASAARAREDGMSHVLAIKYLPQVTDKLSAYLARALAPELQEHAQRILAAGQRSWRDHRSFVELRAFSDAADPSVTTIEAHFPAFTYRVAVSSFW